MSEYDIQAAIIRNALELERLAASDQATAMRIMDDLERDLTELLNQRDLSAARRRDIIALLKDIEEATASRYADIAGVVDTERLVLVVSRQTVETLRSFGNVAAPTPERLASLTKEVLIDGAPSSAWWARQAQDTSFRFAREIRQGVVEGSTNEQIVARIVGRGDEPGILDQARRGVRALVHSSIMTAANRARLETFRKNSKFSRGVRWLATLDGHTCRTCMALDGQAWDFEGNPIDRDGNSPPPMEFQLPPAHFNCRCVASPIPESFDDIFGVKGIDDIFDRDQVRASKDGPTTAMTFGEFLKRQSPEFIAEMLGAKRARLWSQGKITLRDLVSGSGRPLTLDQIEKRI